MEQQISPDVIFEVSWEVCNKVGGIYTVVSTKAPALLRTYEDRLILIGPDVYHDPAAKPEFIEDKNLMASWREQAAAEGLRLKIGRWNIECQPMVILIDFTKFFEERNAIFQDLWSKYKLDSLSGEWDYIEPALFGYAAGKVIESYSRYYLSRRDNVIAQFHEWMTGSGVLYLKDKAPHIATVFTTHATAVGRSIAGNGQPLYGQLKSYNGTDKAREFHITAKHSLEKLSAEHAHAFTTVSEITAKECAQLLERPVDVVTPNGFDNSFVPGDLEFVQSRDAARKSLLGVGRALLQQQLPDNSLLVATSGRYEFGNKGLDVFIEALAKVNAGPKLDRPVVAFILVPANHSGPRRELQDRLNEPLGSTPLVGEILTHGLHGAEHDPVLNKLRDAGLNNRPEDQVKVIFTPVYLNGADGIYNLPYYDLLIGFDLSVFASYYEPWGYTPLESVAFSIPTVTTTLAGFGLWVNEVFGPNHPSCAVIPRGDGNADEVAQRISECVTQFHKTKADEVTKLRAGAYAISQEALWDKLVPHYVDAYQRALSRADADRRSSTTAPEQEHRERPVTSTEPHSNTPSWKRIYIQSEIPRVLQPLVDISRNLWWSWHAEAPKLFERIDPVLWQQVHYNPVALLDSLTLQHYERLKNDAAFITEMTRIHALYQEYMLNGPLTDRARVAYFCMEYGLNTFLKLYSGGLGILAGDYLKECSDQNVPMIAVGLFYRFGYFTQEIALDGMQRSVLNPQSTTQLPVTPVKDEQGNRLRLSIQLPGRALYFKVWRIDVGRIPLYLLDADTDDNIEADRGITGQLYGGDNENRLKQELLLGVGGIRLVEALGFVPEVYHLNEGHAAFIGLERLRKYIQEHQLVYDEAVEVVRGSALFTNHTPVPAGHDVFHEDVLRRYLGYMADACNIPWNQLLGLGRVEVANTSEKFSMSILAAKLSQEVNGVSRIHGEVLREMLNPVWPGFVRHELHVGHVTNGVHYPTWISPEMRDLYSKALGDGFEADQASTERWARIHHVPDRTLWNNRVVLKRRLIDAVRSKLQADLTRRHESPQKVFQLLDLLNPEALTITFARRFATYKRAGLIFSNPQRLSQVLNNPDRPIQIFYAGKAHPADKIGQELIQYIIHLSERPEFFGKIFFLEDYSMDLAKLLVSGSDVWLNTPTRPLEASGTSGMKATMNGVLNLSVLDGWWAEGYQADAGWALPEHNTFDSAEFQNQLDAETIYQMLEDELAPAYFERDGSGLPPKWLKRIKNTLAGIAPQFTMTRMLNQYDEQFYRKLKVHNAALIADDFKLAREMAAWKQHVMGLWNKVEMIDLDVTDTNADPLTIGDYFEAKLVLNLNQLTVDDIGVEVVFTQNIPSQNVINITRIETMAVSHQSKNLVTYSCKIQVSRTGVFDYAFRIFPKHPQLPHRQDFNLVRWVN
jgi:glycogen phosphorylase/synthase